jgi:hypothetical protein
MGVNMPTLIIFLILWVLIGLLAAALASLIGRAEPPYGLAVDIGASVLTMIVVGLVDYAILPLLGYTGTLRFVAMVAEPLVAVVIVLWLLRLLKRRRARTEAPR